MMRRWLIGFMLLVGAGFIWPAGAADVYVIDIRDAIGKGLREYIRRGIQHSEQQGADVIVFDINTPGGALDATLDILDIIQSAQPPTIAFVNTNAFSAGSMIALACDQIVMNPNGGAMGDTAPVSISGEEAPEKAVSAVRGKIEAVADARGRNPDIAAAMVDKSIVLVRLHGKVQALTPTEYEALKDQIEEVIVDSGKLLTLRTRLALELGFADASAESLEALLQQYELVEIEGKRFALTSDAIQRKIQELGQDKVRRLMPLAGANVFRVRMTISERIAALITSPMISALLLSIGMLGILLELRTPGFGVPGFIGILCLGLVFGGHALAHVSAGYAALAFIAGLALLILEIFVIPGFGVAGISGILLMLGSVVFLFGSAYDVNTAMFWLGSSFITTVVVAAVLFSILPRTQTWQRFILSTAERADLGYQAPDKQLESLVGKRGKALTPLRPAGTALIEGRRIDVVTQGEFIERGKPIVVTTTEGPRVVVQEVEDAG